MRAQARMSAPSPEARALIRRYLSEEEEAAWLGLLAMHAAIVSELDARLAGEHQMPPRAFDVLMRVAHAEDGQLPVSELAEQVSVSASQVSRVVMDLERRGLVERRRNPGDARSTCAAITEAGFAALAEAAPTYLETLRERFFDLLSEQDVRALTRAWRKVGADVQPPPDRL